VGRIGVSAKAFSLMILPTGSIVLVLVVVVVLDAWSASAGLEGFRTEDTVGTEVFDRVEWLMTVLGDC
jgi:hypothetical protein